MKSLDSFNEKSDIRVWLCQIAKNCYFSYLRKNKEFVDLESIAERPDNTDLEQTISNLEASAQIHKILHILAEPYKEVFTLRTFGELSFKQIAGLFGKTENWACVTYHRAKNKIREEMEDFK